MLYNLVHNHFKPKLPSENNVPMYLITLSESNKKKNLTLNGIPKTAPTMLSNLNSFRIIR